MWLQYAVTDTGELVSIDQVPRGKIEARCPYCGGELLAKKGNIKIHHFAHAGDTCAAVGRSDFPSLPAYDNFNLHVPGKVLAELRHFVARQPYESWMLEKHELITRNTFRYLAADELTKKGKLIVGQLSLMLFNEFQEPLIDAQHNELLKMAEIAYENPRLLADFITALTDLRIFRAQWRRILTSTLYFVEVNHAGGTLHKVGVTTRDIDSRLMELRADLQPHLGEVNIQVVDTWKHRGNVELYFKHRYAPYQKKVGSLTEYFAFDDVKAVIRDLRRMKVKQLTDLEQAIISGIPSPIEQIAAQDEARSQRRQAIKDGMAEAAQRGQNIGRPMGKEDAASFLAKPKVAAIRAALEGGASIRETARQTQTSVNTVQKVRSILDAMKEG